MSATHPRQISAAVLAGGRSSRMGTDKALLAAEPGGRTMLELALGRLREVASETFIVASGRPEYERFGAPLVADAFPGSGALGGIASALRAARHDRCLVVACDMPLLNPDLLRMMIAFPGDWEVLAPAVDGESRQGRGQVIQTLHAIYAKSCLPAIEARLAAGEYKVIGFFPEVRAVLIPERDLRRHDPELRSLVNANTPEAFAAVRLALAGSD